MKVAAIIPAAGQGVRMGSSVAKQFLELNGEPVLGHALAAFEKAAGVHSVTLVVAPDELDKTRADWLHRPPIVQQVVAGGAQRQDSVYNGFKALPADTDIVVVHDGVRPFVTPELIQQAVDTASRFGACITAIPISDTIKKASPEEFVERTVDREGLWRVQTPQAFQYALLQEAFNKAQADTFYGTDEGALVEHLGKPVKIIIGSELNIKITRPEDLVLAERIADASFFQSGK